MQEEAFEEGERLGRSEDIIKAAQDLKLCNKLYREYDIE